MPKTVRPFLPKPDDPDIIKRVTDATLLGHPIQTAGRMAGIGHTTAWNWLRKGIALLEQNPDVTPEELGSHAVFADAVKRAEAEMVDKLLQRIDVAGKEPRHWAAAMTVLERRFPDSFGRNQRLPEAPGALTVSVTAALSQRQVASLLQALAEDIDQERVLPPIPPTSRLSLVTRDDADPLNGTQP